MDINLIVLNVGNSRVAAGAMIAGEMQYVTRVPHARKDDWPGVLAELWAKVRGREDPAIAGASVHPDAAADLAAAVRAATGQDVQWVGKDLDLPIKVLTEQPDQTGVDRVLNVAAAYEQIQKACVVVDAGTAITVDVCNDAGEFLGGAIAPGASVLLDALHERTAQLPHVKLGVPDGPIGRSTEQAILHGAFHGVRGMVKELVENYATELGSWPDVIATGGDAPALFDGWELIHAISPDLTLYGVALAFTNHHIKHGT